MIDGFKASAVLADRGYDADYIVEGALKCGAEAVIPPKLNRNSTREYDKSLYKERNMVERLFNKLKHFRRVATRYDKTASAFLGFVYIVSVCLWLK